MIQGKPVIAIGDWAFNNNATLTAVLVPSSVESIGGSAFSNCPALRTVVMQEGVRFIGGWAFWNDNLLETIVVPSSVKAIDHSAFDCMLLRAAYFCGDCPNAEWSVFGGFSLYESRSADLTLYVKKGASGWDSSKVTYFDVLPDFGFGDKGAETDDSGEKGDKPVVPVSDVTPDFDGSSAHTFNGLVYDSGVMCGIVQIITAKATAKGVKVSGSVILDDGKKQTIKAVTAQVSGGYLKVSTTVGKLGNLAITIGGNGFKGTLGDMTVATADVDESTGIMSATVKVQYFDAKTGKIMTKSYKLTGVTSDGEAVGNVSLKNDVKTFESVIE